MSSQGSQGRLPEGEELSLWLSAFLDGELADEEEAAVRQALERDPALMAELEALDAVRLRGPGPVDVADAVMTAVAPEHVASTTEGAGRLASAASDGELAPEGQAHLEQMLADRAAAAELSGFFDVVDAGRAGAEGALAHPGLPAWLGHIPDEVAEVVADDARAAELGGLALDGEATAAERRELAGLYADPAHGAWRQAEVQAFAALSQSLRMGFEHLAAAPEAEKAGAAALQALSAAEHQARDEAAQKASRAEAPAQQGSWEKWAARLRGFAPVGFALGAAALFFLAGEPAQPGGSAGAERLAFEDFLEEVDQQLGHEAQEQKVALGEDLPILSDNESDVLSIDTNSQATLVFETEASNITVIWVPEPADDPGAGDPGHIEETQGT